MDLVDGMDFVDTPGARTASMSSTKSTASTSPAFRERKNKAPLVSQRGSVFKKQLSLSNEVPDPLN